MTDYGTMKTSTATRRGSGNLKDGLIHIEIPETRMGSSKIRIISPENSPRKSSSRKEIYKSERTLSHIERGHTGESPAPEISIENSPILRKGDAESQKSGDPRHALEIESGQHFLSGWFSCHDRVQVAIHLSLVINIILCAAKMYAVVATGSLAVLSSLVDSCLDLTSQFIFWWSDKHSRIPNVEYPAGRTRLEPIGIIIAAALMGMAALEVIQTSIEALIKGWEFHEYPEIEVSAIALAILLSAIISKLGLWWFCSSLASASASARALAQDHRNDVLSNLVAIIASYWSYYRPQMWFADPLGGIAISIYIAFSWIQTGKEHVDQLVGKKAEEDFIEELRQIASDHHPLLQPDIIRAYHFGCNFLVEIEAVLPEDMNVKEAHDIGLSLQIKVEQLDRVERAFVHIDYLSRDYDEHKVPTVSRKSSKD